MVICAAHAAAALPPPLQPGSQSGAVSGVIDEATWATIRAAYQAGRHAVVPAAGGHQARNPGQQWTTHFDGRGFEVSPDNGGWSWGLDLTGYGRADDIRSVGRPLRVDAQGTRVTYMWSPSLSEWYKNDARGVEHGYTISEPPPGLAAAGSPLCLTLAIRGGLSPQISGSGRDIAFVNGAGAAVVTYHGLTVFDADGRHVPARFEVAAGGLMLLVHDAGSRYPLTIDPVAQQAYLKASNTGSGDGFGISIAASGDTVVVGAQSEASSATGVNGNQADNSAPGAGAAYVFVRHGDTWSQQAYLKASNTNAADNFGWSVAIDGDTIVVGAYREDSSATGVNGNQGDNSALGSGAAYVFVRDGDTWSQQAYLKASNTGIDDFFGWSVGVSGDTIVVGAYREGSAATGVDGNQTDDSAYNAGAAYVFARDPGGSTWTQQAYLKASNTAPLDFFGISVAVSGDTVVVGSALDDSIAPNSGAAFVYARTGSTWSPQATLKASNADADDAFGFSVAAAGNTIVVGARNESSAATGVGGDQSDNSAYRSGAAYVFVRDPGASTWSQQAYLKASNTGVEDYFGWSVAASGDTTVVGAYLEDGSATGIDGDQASNAAPDAGAAYVFARQPGGSTWSQLAYLKPSSTNPADFFGRSVAVSGDLVAVGAFGEDSAATGVNGNDSNNSASGSGAAYVFIGVGAECAPPQVAEHPISQTRCPAAAVSFSVSALGTGSLQYQWRRDGQALSDGGEIIGVRTPMLTISPAQVANAGVYDCIVTNGCGTATSNTAALVICAADFDCSGFADFDDFTAFVSEFEAGADSADFDQSGFVDYDDFIAFVLTFEAGC